MSDKHSSFIKTPKQLVIVVVLAFAIPIALIVLVSQLVTGVRSPGRDAETGVLNRIKPVGEVTIAEATAPQAGMTGEQVYQDVCKTCHEAGLVGAPKLGDKTAWAPRIKRGINALYASAIDGKNQMPPKGGSPTSTCNAGSFTWRIDRAETSVSRLRLKRRSSRRLRRPPQPLPRQPRSRQPRHSLQPVRDRARRSISRQARR